MLSLMGWLIGFGILEKEGEMLLLNQASTVTNCIRKG